MLIKQIHLFKNSFVIFLKGAMFSDFFETIKLQTLSYPNPISAILRDLF